MLRILTIVLLLPTLLLVSGCEEATDPSEGEGRIQAEDVQREVSEAADAAKDYALQEVETFTHESRDKLAEWRSGVKTALETRSSTAESVFQRKADDLLEKIDLSEENLEDLKGAGQENWEKVKREIQDLLSQIEEEYHELFQ